MKTLLNYLKERRERKLRKELVLKCKYVGDAEVRLRYILYGDKSAIIDEIRYCVSPTGKPMDYQRTLCEACKLANKSDFIRPTQPL